MKKRRTKDSQTLSKELSAVDRPESASNPAPPNPDPNHSTPEASQAPQQPSMQPAVSSASAQHHAQSANNAASINNIINNPANAAQAPQQPQPQQQQQQRERTTRGKYSQEDFQLQRTLGTGSFGRVHLVQSKHNHRFYAMKVLKKAQVVKMKQIEHTNDERRMLNRVRHPFLVTLWGTWQDSRNLYMVMDFVEGGELFSLLRKSQVS